MNNSIVLLVVAVLISLSFPLKGECIETASRITDREIIEALEGLKGDIKRIDQRFGSLEKQIDQRFESMDQRFESIDRRFESIDRRFESIDQRFESMDRRFDELRGFMLWGYGVTFAGIFSLIGFVLWDRRTALAPAVRKNKELEEKEEKMEKALKEVAAKDSNMAEALRHVGLL